MVSGKYSSCGNDCYCSIFTYIIFYILLVFRVDELKLLALNKNVVSIFI